MDELNEVQQKSYAIATNWEPVPAGYKPVNLYEFYTNLKDSGKSEEKNFSYVSADTDLLGWAIENAAGQNLFVDGTNNIVITKFSSWKKPTDYMALPLTHVIVKKVRKLLNRNS